MSVAAPVSDTFAPRTLIDIFLPGIRRSRSWGVEAALIVGASFVVALSARVSIHLPFTPVPITGQTFAVLLTGMLLGARRGAMALALYLLEGAAGLPVFADGSGSLAKLVGPTAVTAGYLWSYPVVAALLGYLAEHGWDRRPFTAAFAMALGSAIILISGSTVLCCYGAAYSSLHIPTGIEAAFLLGAAPFIPGEAVKTLVATMLLPGGWKLVRLLQRDK